MLLEHKTQTERREKVNNKEKIFIKACILFLVLLTLSSIVCNILFKEVAQSANNEPYKPFSVTVSEEKWDESMMPKGKRSPKGVLYNPEK
jgi:hypothetical protein